MPPTFPVPTSDHRAGFSLVEAIVATAVVALMVAAAASSVVAARSASAAGHFLREALAQANREQVVAYGALPAEEPDGSESLLLDREEITADDAEQIPVWRVITVRTADHQRRITFSLEAAGLP